MAQGIVPTRKPVSIKIRFYMIKLKKMIFSQKVITRTAAEKKNLQLFHLYVTK